MEGKPYQFMSRDEARAAGIPVPPDAVGVRIYGATVGEPQLPAEADELAREMWEATDEPIHLWFGLSYASCWKHDRDEVEGSPPMAALTCDKCGKTSKARLRTCRYEVIE